jgi:hypothetical protein
MAGEKPSGPVLQGCSDGADRAQGLADPLRRQRHHRSEDGQAQAVADQFGADLRGVVDRMIKDGINLPKAGLCGN